MLFFPSYLQESMAFRHFSQPSTLNLFFIIITMCSISRRITSMQILTTSGVFDVSGYFYTYFIPPSFEIYPGYNVKEKYTRLPFGVKNIQQRRGFSSP